MHSNAKKQVLRMLHNGMYVMTSGGEDRQCAATVTWISQACFKPPLIMAAIRRRSQLFECLAESQLAVINILGRSRLDVARKFFSGTQSVDGLFADERFAAGSTSAPVLQSACAYVECRVRRILDDVGDHAIVLLEVVAAECREQVPALTAAELPWKYAG